MLGKNNARSALKRRIAILGAALILTAQFVAAVHWHLAPGADRVAAASERSLDNGLCALCLLGSHSNFNPTASPSIEQVGFASRFTPRLSHDCFLSSRSVSTLTRAPPLAA